MKKTKLLWLSLLISVVPTWPAQAQTSEMKAPAPPQQFVIEVEVPAPVSEVWHAFSTSEGLSTWLFPNATVDLRPGGDWMVHFPGGGSGGGTIVSFVPEKELERTRAVFTFEPRGNATIVRLTQTGWKSGEEWTRAYEYLLAGNAQLLATLHKRFVDGPVDWGKAK